MSEVTAQKPSVAAARHAAYATRARFSGCRLPASASRCSTASRLPAPGSRSPPGFTLIELLVVIVIAGVLAAALVISVGGSSERQLANTSERFQALLGFACAQAELTGREIGAVLDADGYSFRRLDGNEWRAFGDAVELRPRKWPAGLKLELTRAGRPLDLATPGHDAPQVVCFSSGELSPFSLSLGLGESPQRYRTDGADDGTLKTDRVESPP